MRRTVNIKLPLENRRYLEKTIQQFKKACQMTVEEGWIEEGLKTYSKFNLQERIYGELREATDLQANLVIRAIARGAQAIKGCVERLKNGFKASKPEFTSDSIAYDKRTLTVDLENHECSISTIEGRIDAEFVLPEKQNEY